MRAGRLRSQGTVIAAWRAMRMTVSREHTPSARGCGEIGFPHAPARGRAWPSSRVWGNRVSPPPRPREGVGGQSPQAGVWGNRVSPHPPLFGGARRLCCPAGTCSGFGAVIPSLIADFGLWIAPQGVTVRSGTLTNAESSTGNGNRDGASS